MGKIILNGTEYAGSGGSGGHTIVDPTGTDMPQENKLQFTGAVSVSDDAVNGQTVVDIEGGGNYYLNTLYSTEEKKIGYWTDGKPLYQICITGSYTGTWGTRTIASKSALNIDTFVKGEPNMHFTQSNNVWYNVGAYANVYINDDNVQLTQSFTNQSRNFIYNVTLQYTKTTDTPETNPQTGGVIYLPSIYSDEEREVGVWRDGKPLYQKSINIGAVTANTVKVIDITSLNVDYVADYIATAVLTNGWKVPLPQTHTSSMSYQAFCRLSSSTQLAVGVGSSVGISDGYVTLQYTKTTDVAGSGTWTPSGANAVHYSTNEQVVGTWIDGKPLYEKVVKSTTTPTANAWNTVALPADISVKIFDAYYVRTTGDVDKFSMYRSNTNPAEMLVCTINNSRVDYQISSQYVANFSEFVVIIQYTKTTDV